VATNLDKLFSIIQADTFQTNILAAYNRRLAKKRVQCLNEALCFVSSSVLADSLVLRNPLLRQAAFQDQKQVFS
jgi:hypothetical protein